MTVAPGTRLGSYEVTAQIDAGGIGEVYRALDTKLKRQVATKILPPSLATDDNRLARFQRQVDVLACPRAYDRAREGLERPRPRRSAATP